MNHPCHEDLPEVSPLRENALTLQKLDMLLPIFSAFADELEEFKKSLGNGAFNIQFKWTEED
jgi:hypothetical protein